MRREPNTHSLASKLGLQGILDTIINICTSPYLVAIIAFAQLKLTKSKELEQ